VNVCIALSPSTPAGNGDTRTTSAWSRATGVMCVLRAPTQGLKQTRHEDFCETSPPDRSGPTRYGTPCQGSPEASGRARARINTGLVADISPATDTASVADRHRPAGLGLN
jgi:hypothetical protein